MYNKWATETRHCIHMLGYSMVQHTCTTRGPQRLDTASTCWATAWYNIHVQQEGYRDQTLHPHVGLQHGTIYMYNKRATETRHCIHMLGYSMVQYTCTTRGPQGLDTASTCWATAWYNIHVQQEGHRDQTLHPHVGLQHGTIYMYNKRATGTRHCIHMLGYSMVQHICTTRGPQRLDTASTCWATAWYYIHVQQEGHRDQTLHPHVGLQHGTIYMYNKKATETRYCIHMLGYSMVQYTCATRGPQKLDTASTCWATAWYNIHVQQEGHRDQTLHPHVGLQHGTIYMYNKKATETRYCIHMLGYSMVQYTCTTRGPQRLDTASTCWGTAWYNIHVQQEGHREQTLHPHVGLQHGTIYMYNKRATETRHCIHMLGYSMVQYTCTTRGPQRLDTASTCWATAWYNIHVQQESHRDQILHPHVGLQHGTIYMCNKRATETRHCIHMLGYSMVQYTCTTSGPQRLDIASTCWATAWYNIHVQQEGHRDQILHPHVGLQHGTIYMYNKRATETRHCIHMLGYSMVQYTCTTRGPQRLDTASTCWATTWYNIHVQQVGHRDQTLHPHVGLQHGTIYMYNKRATETRHCIHMLGYSMVQYTCTTRGPQRLDTASTCWATAWYNIHVQQVGHRDQTLHPHVGLQHGTIYMYNKRATETRHCIHMLGYSMVQYTCTTSGPQRLDTASTCWGTAWYNIHVQQEGHRDQTLHPHVGLQHGTIYMYNKRATETRHCIHMLGYNMVQYTCTTSGPQRLDTASTCWATAWYNIHVQQEGHRDQTLHPHVGLQHGTIYMYNKRASETRHCIHMLGYSMVQYTCTTRGPQRLDTASTCWATAWYNIHVQQEGHRDQTLHPHVWLQYGTVLGIQL